MSECCASCGTGCVKKQSFVEQCRNNHLCSLKSLYTIGINFDFEGCRLAGSGQREPDGQESQEAVQVA